MYAEVGGARGLPDGDRSVMGTEADSALHRVCAEQKFCGLLVSCFNRHERIPGRRIQTGREGAWLCAGQEICLALLTDSELGSIPSSKWEGVLLSCGEENVLKGREGTEKIEIIGRQPIVLVAFLRGTEGVYW